ncbi:MAG: L-ribulose-5-phosphate 4-epimerase, partial [Ignavibacteria bacterium]|nr:L-ribulose-5-phosphate 4-epimerase [Ignavibacteria bacterium]
VIVERFKELNPVSMPGVLVAGHAPFKWGINASDSVKNSLILERVAEMAFGTYQLKCDTKELPEFISEKHYQRKHGPDAYYGQK